MWWNARGTFFETGVMSQNWCGEVAGTRTDSFKNLHWSKLQVVHNPDALPMTTEQDEPRLRAAQENWNGTMVQPSDAGAQDDDFKLSMMVSMARSLTKRPD